jgi:hypothetical protein
LPDIRAMQVNFEILLEILEGVWSTKTVKMRICNWASNTNNNFKNWR